MPSTFPGAIDSFTDPLANSSLSSPSHSTLHSDINDAVEKVEQYMGLVKVIPTSVSSAGGTAATLNSTTGTVTVGNGNTSVTVNGAFSSLYDNYRVIYQGGVGSTEISIQMQLGASTTQYYSQLTYAAWSATSVTVLTGNNSAKWLYIGSMDANSTYLNADIFSPALAKYTMFSAPYVRDSLGGSQFGVHKVATAYTSFTVTPEAGTITGGTIRVYGYRN